MFRNPLIDGVVILIVVLLILGPKRLPELGKGLGRGMREFKEGISGDSNDDDHATLNAAPSEPAARPPAEPSSAERREVGSDPKA